MDDFDPRTRARNSDPLSSHEAAENSAQFSGPHRMRILRALVARGPSTAHELQPYTGLTVVQIDRRLPELQTVGLADVDTWPNGQDVMRGNARVWKAVEQAA
jgi:predicted transcriptional regulator